MLLIVRWYFVDRFRLIFKWRTWYKFRTCSKNFSYERNRITEEIRKKNLKRFESVNKRKELSCSLSSETFNPCVSCYITNLKFHMLSREVFVEMGICFDRSRTDLIPTYNRVDPRPLKHSKAIIIFLIGGPGVGKSTLGKKIASRYGFVLVLVSALLREEVARGTEMGLQYKRFMEKGTIVPAPLIIQLLMQKMLAYPSAYGYLIVGFPRDRKQVNISNIHTLLCFVIWDEFWEMRTKGFRFI